MELMGEWGNISIADSKLRIAECFNREQRSERIEHGAYELSGQYFILHFAEPSTNITRNELDIDSHLPPFTYLCFAHEPYINVPFNLF
jgi:hypothetical protein